MSTGRILIVDDDPQIRRVMRMTLVAQGYEIDDAPSGDEALERMRAARFDLVLLDMNMPGVSGTLTLSFIKHLTRLAHTRIIIVSGHPELAASAKAVWGADLSLAKPVSPRQRFRPLPCGRD